MVCGGRYEISHGGRLTPRSRPAKGPLVACPTMHPNAILRAAVLAAIVFFALAAGQQPGPVLAGVVRFGGEIPPGARVGLHVVDLKGRTVVEELASAEIGPEGEFRLALPVPPGRHLATQVLDRDTFRLPGATGPLTVEPPTARFVATRLQVYIDADFSGGLTAGDRIVIALVTRGPTRYAAYLFVDRDVRLATPDTGFQVTLARGWNLVGVEIVNGGRRAQGEIIESAEDFVIEAIIL